MQVSLTRHFTCRLGNEWRDEMSIFFNDMHAMSFFTFHTSCMFLKGKGNEHGSNRLQYLELRTVFNTLDVGHT